MLESEVPDDILENNIIQCFSGVRRTQFFLGSVRTVMRGRVVELPNKWHNLYSLIFVVCAAFSEAYFQLFYYRAFYHKNKILFYSCFVGTCFGFVSYNACFFMSRFTNRELNVKIYYMLQKIDRILQLTRDTYYTGFQATVQNRINALICSLFPLAYSLHVMSLLDRPICSSFLIPLILSGYIDLLLLAGFLYYIGVRIGIFNKMLKNHIKKYEEDEPKQNKRKTVVQMIMSVVKPSYDQIDNILEWDRWSECIQQILKSYEMVNDIYNFQIANVALTVIIWTLIIIGGLVAGYWTGLYPLVATVTICIWTIFYAVVLTVLSLIAGWISYKIKETKVLCVRVMSHSTTYDDPHRKAASEVLRIIHYKKPQLVVYGIFKVDTTLPLTVMGIVATNVLVVIQYVVSRGYY